MSCSGARGIRSSTSSPRQYLQWSGASLSCETSKKKKKKKEKKKKSISYFIILIYVYSNIVISQIPFCSFIRGRKSHDPICLMMAWSMEWLLAEAVWWTPAAAPPSIMHACLSEHLGGLNSGGKQRRQPRRKKGKWEKPDKRKKKSDAAWTRQYGDHCWVFSWQISRAAASCWPVCVCAAAPCHVQTQHPAVRSGEKGERAETCKGQSLVVTAQMQQK